MQLTRTELTRFKSLGTEPDEAVKFWKDVGERLRFNFFPKSGQIPIVYLNKDGTILLTLTGRSIREKV